MNLNETLFKNYVKSKIMECIDESKEKVKIPFIKPQKIQDAMRIFEDMNCDFSAYWRDRQQDYVIVIYGIKEDEK
ncbi:hypothetical protein [Staphylococcus shinii]|uniref:hypothetical protein n=1 Tax=Staphylococcus shinii TaxID=2912228 RepID=UPI003EE917EC